MHDVAMIAADTTRTIYYIEELIKSGLLPHYVLLLLNSNSELLPGQKEVETETENELITTITQYGESHSAVIKLKDQLKTLKKELHLKINFKIT